MPSWEGREAMCFTLIRMQWIGKVAEVYGSFFVYIYRRGISLRCIMTSDNDFDLILQITGPSCDNFESLCFSNNRVPLI
jgi:hypothetical protein